jgi:hypothetical protein
MKRKMSGDMAGRRKPRLAGVLLIGGMTLIPGVRAQAAAGYVRSE